MRRHALRAVCAGLLALALTSCGGTRPSRIDVHTNVAVRVTPTPDTLPFDPRSARITAASQELAAIAGHPVVLDVDAAMVPEFRSSFEDAVGQAFENLARDLDRLRKSQAGVFAFGAPRLEHVRLRYDAALERDEATFDPATRTLAIRGPARRDALVHEGVLAAALTERFGAETAAHFADASPDGVAPGERRAYFAYLTGRGPGRASPSDGTPKTAAELAESRRAARILAALRLAELAGSDRYLAADVERWLVDQISWFLQQYLHASTLVRALPVACTFRRAEAAFTRWMLAEPAVTTTSSSSRGGGGDAKRLAVAHALFARSFTGDRDAQGGLSYPPFAWPGADRFAFGLRVVDEWRAAGHRTPASAPRPSVLEELVVCPRASGAGSHIGPRCDYDFYRFALEVDGGRARLARAIVERDDPFFTETAFSAMGHASEKPLETKLAMLQLVEKSPRIWATGMSVLADSVDNVHDRLLLEEAQRLWLEHPDRRGAVLHLLARIDRYGHGNVDWRGFREAFGDLTTQGELRSYLGHGSMAMALLPVVWPALDKGYARAAEIIPRLDAFLADDAIRMAMSNGHHRVLYDIVGRLCAEKNVADLAALRRYLEDRAKRVPGETYGQVAEATSSDRCAPPPPPPPPRNEVRLVSSKKRLAIIQKGAP